MANPTENLPSAIPLKTEETPRLEETEETTGDLENTVSSKDNSDGVDNAVAGPSSSKTTAKGEAVPLPSLKSHDISKRKQRRRRRFKKVESSSDSSSSDESVILARIQAKKRALERAKKEKSPASKKRKRM
ncbi:uncharacterized protein LOC106717162 isoform X2 [Papilio machaon]|uniref:uncharacterized protein LOC106717162 isoform X2 n=1 Tax=Papilio machaon TaxID=76193 RepID=UPI001E66553C|nr:uncharacterized protein LOC106717162 isoform X2 [Papilio machaon]